jgi:hypothetical protein
MNSDAATESGSEPLRALAMLVIKDGVMLGGLGEAQRALALGLVWAGLPQAAMTERAVNEALKVQLASTARCLDTDHVELRRWLCDTGWLARDGYGREYHRVGIETLPPGLQALGAAMQRAFATQAPADFVTAAREARAAERQARRRAFEARA